MSVTVQPENVQIEAGWKQALLSEFSDPYFAALKQFLLEEKKSNQVVYPPANLIFNAFNLTPFDAVKVVILGQDPYINPQQAHGLSFSVPMGVGIPRSLDNMYKELKEDIGLVPPRHGNLESWARQGVLLLNSILTVRAGASASHQGKGWERFTDAAMKALNDRHTGIVYLLWGSYAQQKGAVIDPQKNCILKAPHPSPLSASRGFFGCRHFSQTNAYLTSIGKTPINWQL